MRHQESQGVQDSYYSLSIKQSGQVLCDSILGEVNPHSLHSLGKFRLIILITPLHCSMKSSLDSAVP